MFGKRLNLLTFFGIKIGLDISWFFIALLLTWTLASGYFPSLYPGLSNTLYWVMGLIGMLCLFICVLLHELGHAMVAKYYRLPISQITLFIFGGVAEIKKEPDSPKVEFWVALAGPLVSVFLAFGMAFLTVLGKQLGWPLPLIGVTAYLASINTLIVVFNLIPAFPLDGGRIFRAFLWWWKKDLKLATRISSTLGSVFGFILIAFGAFYFITGNFLPGVWLVILGLFLRGAASSSTARVFISKELEGEKVSRFMTKDPIAVSPNISLKEFIDRFIYQSHHHLYPVVENERLLGTLSLKEVKTTPSEEWERTSVKEVMIPLNKLQVAGPDTSALKALDWMQEAHVTTLVVVQEGRLVGVVTAQDLFKLISLKLELEG